MNMQTEMAKSQATLQNLINAVKYAEEGKGEVDILGSLLALSDQLNRLDEAIDKNC